jgi:hypothetical protein
MYRVRIVFELIEYHFFITAFRVFDKEFRRRYTNVRRLARTDAPAWQLNRETERLVEYMKAKYFRGVAK